MVVYLDTNIVIYLVENRPIEGPKAAARLAKAYAAGDTMALSDLTRMECLVGPLRSNNAVRLADFNAFFTLSTMNVLRMPPTVFDRAARVRAVLGFKAADSLHLACAAEHGCGLFLTNDARLARFPDIPVEILT